MMADVSCGRFCLRSCMRRMSDRCEGIGWIETATEDRSVVMRVIGSMGLIGRKESLDEGGL